MSADEPPAGPLELATIFRRRWAPQTIALLESRRGERFVSLCHELGAHQGAVRDTLDYLMEIGIVIRNPGYGHPLRPEYILTPIGSRVAPMCADLGARVKRDDLGEPAWRRWTMPLLLAVGRGPTRFGEAARAVAQATDRAVSMGLRDLGACALVERTVIPASPPMSEYASTRAGRLYLPTLEELARACAPLALPPK